MDLTTAQRNTRINVNEASREQIIELLKQHRTLLRQEQLKNEELEQQVRGLHELIDEKNAELTALRQQGNMLTEKAASDEETIKALIKKLEETHSATAATTQRRQGGPQGAGESSAAGPGGPGIVTGKVASGASQTVSPTITAARPPHRALSSSSGANAGDAASNAAAAVAAQEADLQEKLTASAEVISSKNSEIVTLETKVRELMEVNAFYTAIVAQHDDEEKRRHMVALKAVDKRSDNGVEDIPALLHRIASLESHQEKLQRVVKQSEREKHTLLSENAQLRDDATRLEMEMVLSEQWARRKDSLNSLNTRTEASSLSSPPPRQSPAAAAHGLPQATPERVPAQVMTSPLLFGRPNARTGGVRQVSPLAPSAHSRDVHPGQRVDIHALPAINIRNPDPQERELLDRIHLYEDYITSMERYESDRQAGFDEMERTRAELFANMNEQLERQRKELHHLRRVTSLGTSNSAASLNTVTSLNDDGPIPRTSTQAELSPSRASGVAVAVQTELAAADEETNVHAHRPHPEGGRELEYDLRRAEGLFSDTEGEGHNAVAGEVETMSAAFCLERDEAEARLKLYVQCGDERMSCLHTHWAALENSCAQETMRQCESRTELLSRIEELTHLTESIHSVETVHTATVSERDCEVQKEAPVDFAVSAPWLAFLAELDNVLHREEVSACLDMYGDSLMAYAALLSAHGGPDGEAVRHESEEARLNESVLEDVRRLAALPLAPLSVIRGDGDTAQPVTGSQLQPGTREEHFVTCVSPGDEPASGNPIEASGSVNSTAVSEEAVDTDINVDAHASQREQRDLAVEENIGALTVPDSSEFSSAPDSQRSSPLLSSLYHNDDGHKDDALDDSEEDSTDARGQAESAVHSVDVLQELAVTQQHTDATVEEDESELLRQLAAEAETMNDTLKTASEKAMPHSDPCESERSESLSAVSGPPSNAKGRTEADYQGDSAEQEHEPCCDDGVNVDGDDAIADVDSSAPASGSDAYDEALHPTDSITESDGAPVDTTLDHAAQSGSEGLQLPEVGSADAGGQESETLLPSDAESSSVRPKLPPLPESCTGETVAAAIDACHQYALSRHASRPTSPRRSCRSAMSSNRTSTSMLDSWSRNAPTFEGSSGVVMRGDPSSQALPLTPHQAQQAPTETGPEPPVASTTPPTFAASEPEPAPAPPPTAPHPQPQNLFTRPFSMDTTSTDDDFEPEFDPFA